MLTTLLTIWLFHLAAVVTPGANSLLVSQMAAAHGRTARYAVLGVALGGFIWSASAVLGLHLVFEHFPELRMGLQLAGAAYLFYVAWRTLRAASAPTADDAAPLPSLTRAAAFRQGLLTNLTNPKSALFFGSIFAAAFPPAPSLGLQITTVLVVVANCLCWYGVVVWLFSRPAVRDAYARWRARINRIAAAAFGALGLGLVVAVVREQQ